MFVSTHGITARPTSSAYGTLTTAWIAATGETDLTILGALNTLESDLTTYGLTSKMKALYPFVGGSSTKHSYNFINTSQYQITWYGGVTHNSNGITGNASNGYGDTGLNDDSILSLNNAHISIYSRTDKDALMCDIGCITPSSNQGINLFSKYSSGFYARVHDAGASGAITNNGTSQRLFIANRVGSSENRNYQDGTLKQQTVTSISKTNRTICISVFAYSDNTFNFYSDRNYSFASIGDGLTDQNMSDLTTAVNAFQTTLSRNV